MDKEKEIEEIEKIIENTMVICDDYICIGAHETAEKIVNIGYRKADEVRKETAKEILKEVRQNAGGRWLAELCEKYGVEVDE